MTLSATLAGRPHTDVSGLKSTLAGVQGSNLGSPDAGGATCTLVRSQEQQVLSDINYGRNLLHKTAFLAWEPRVLAKGCSCERLAASTADCVVCSASWHATLEAVTLHKRTRINERDVHRVTSCGCTFAQLQCRSTERLPAAAVRLLARSFREVLLST
jgi:hypothetical protein